MDLLTDTDIANLPITVNTTQLMAVYLEKLRRLAGLLQVLSNNELSHVARVHYTLCALNQHGINSNRIVVDMSKYGYDVDVPLCDYCRIFDLNYNTIMLRMRNKCMTPLEAIMYGEKKAKMAARVKWKRGRSDAKLNKQRAHLERIIECLAADAAEAGMEIIG